MASTNLAAVAAALSLLYRPRLASSINSTVVLPFLLPVVPGEGKAVYWTVEVTGAANAVAATEGAARDSSDADAEVEVPANLPWSIYDKVSSVTDLAASAASSNFNPGSIGALGNDLLLGRTVGQWARVVKGVAADMYAGDETATPPELCGAARFIDSSGSICGIDPGTYTEWAAVEQTGALASITFDTLTAFLSAVYDACGEMPEFVTCPSNVFNHIKSLFTNYEAHVLREFPLSRGGGADGSQPRVAKFDGGGRVFEFEGIPFVRDGACTANTMYAWNTNYVELQQLDPYHGVLAGGEAAIQDVFRAASGNANLRLPEKMLEGMMARSSGIKPSIKVLGDRGLSKEAVIYAQLQMCWKRRNAFAKYVATV